MEFAVNAARVVVALVFAVIIVAFVRDLVGRLRQARLWDRIAVLMVGTVIGLVIGLIGLVFVPPSPMSISMIVASFIPTAVLFVVARRDMKRTQQEMLRHLMQINQAGAEGPHDDDAQTALK